MQKCKYTIHRLCLTNEQRQKQFRREKRAKKKRNNNAQENK